MRSPYRPLLFWAVVPLSGENRLLDWPQTPRGESVCPGEPLVWMGRFSPQLPEAVRCAGRGSCSDCHICAGDRPCRQGSGQAPLDRGPSRAPAHHGRRGRGPAQPPRPRRLLLLGAPHGPREDRGLGRDGHQGDSQGDRASRQRRCERRQRRSGRPGVRGLCHEHRARRQDAAQERRGPHRIHRHQHGRGHDGELQGDAGNGGSTGSGGLPKTGDSTNAVAATVATVLGGAAIAAGLAFVRRTVPRSGPSPQR